MSNQTITPHGNLNGAGIQLHSHVVRDLAVGASHWGNVQVVPEWSVVLPAQDDEQELHLLPVTFVENKYQHFS